MTRSHRIALGSILTECNHLGGLPTDLARFEQYELRRGSEVLEQHQGVVGGMLQVLTEHSADVVPLLAASTCPGGPLTAECYRQLKTELLDGLRQSLPVSGVLLALHGAAAIENEGDLEGDLLQSVRELVGEHIPIVATLDLHAHVTEKMVINADALLAWETYPHQDAFTTGERGARMLLGILDGKWKPTMALAKVPVVVSGCLGHTEGPGPFADVMRFAKSHEGHGSVLSTNVFLVHPYLDLPEMGGGGLVITDNDMPRAEELACDIARRYWDRRFDLEPEVFTLAEAIRRGLAIAGGPVLLIETSDCAGGGAAGDSVASLRALLKDAPTYPALVPVVDPHAAQVCHRAGVNAEVNLELGHTIDPQWGQPISVRGKVARLSDGRFQYTGGIWSGTWAEMGPSAVLQVGPIQILITTNATYDWADEQYRSLGLDPATAKFVVVKNPMNYRFGYAGLSKAALILDTPGPTPPTLKHYPFRNLRPPYFPADQEIPNLKPRVSHGHRLPG